MQELITSIQNAFCMAGGSAGLSAVFLSAMLVLWHLKNKDIDLSNLFWYGVLVLIVIISPLYIWLVNSLYPAMADNNMHLWILPVTQVVLYVIVWVLAQLKDKNRLIFFTVGMIAILFLAVIGSYDQNEFKLVKANNYIDSKELAVFEKLLEYVDKNNKDSLLFWGPEELSRDVRLVDGRIYTLYGKELYMGEIDSELHQLYDSWYEIAFMQMEKGAEYLDDIVSKAEAKGCDAFALRSKSFTDNNMDIPDRINLKYYLYYYDDNYCLYMKY